MQHVSNKPLHVTEKCSVGDNTKTTNNTLMVHSWDFQSLSCFKERPSVE